MLTCLVVTSQSIAREREMGTFDQLLVSPLSPLEIMIGKIVPGIIIGACEGLLMWAAGTMIMGVPFTGSFLLFLLGLIVFVAAISGIGLFISSLCSTQQQAMLGTFVFMLPSVLLSGFATPIENMPIWLQPITFLIPLRYMLIISKGLFLKALPYQIVFSEVWPMIIIALFTLSISGLFFRRQLS
jgi:ABC-2 type transport system permease protein